jgi:UDP-glucose 4-epimerase
VTDVAAGIVAALEKGMPGTAYNVGTGEGRTNNDVLKIIEPLAVAAGLRMDVKRLPPRNFDVPGNSLDSQRLRSVSGWRPRVALEDGIRRLWETIYTGHP